MLFFALSHWKAFFNQIHNVFFKEVSHLRSLVAGVAQKEVGGVNF